MKQNIFFLAIRRLIALMLFLTLLVYLYQPDVNLKQLDSPAKRTVVQELRSLDYKQYTPRFNDLYIIKSHAKNRDVIVYCNAEYCYKKRFNQLAV